MKKPYRADLKVVVIHNNGFGVNEGFKDLVRQTLKKDLLIKSVLFEDIESELSFGSPADLVIVLSELIDYSEEIKKRWTLPTKFVFLGQNRTSEEGCIWVKNVQDIPKSFIPSTKK
jgi:hypothetical protein